jgi:epsin
MFLLSAKRLHADVRGSTSTFYEIMDILDKRLNDKGKNWRHVLKSLKVLDYCLHEGSELVVTWARKNIYVIKTLREFQHIDEDGRDVGQNSELIVGFCMLYL